MLFSSATFLFAFLPVVALLYYLIPKRCTAARNLFLTGASLLFYAWGEPRFVLVMLLVIVSSWLFARKIEASAKSARKGFLLVAVSVDLTVLFVFKYLGFFTENLNRLPFVRLPVPQITLPIGISFFTFQAISYVVDVYRGEAAQKSLWDVMLYIAFFPQLIAGPIVRYSDFADQIHNRQESLQNWNRGGYRFAIGLGKKVILSNNLAYVADAAFSSVGNLSFSMAWIGAVGYSLQLYFDFAGYSEMSNGLSLMMGFECPANFNLPYISGSITEFWRRWHISLSGWFRDYIYIPLGGNRCSAGRQMLNMLAVWALTGIWHGANWNFICWGLYYFVLLVIEKNFLMKYLKKGKVWPHIYTLFLVVLGWGLFTCNAPGAPLGLLLSRLFIPQGGVSALYFLRNYAVLLVVCCVCSTQLPGRFWQCCKGKAPLRAALCGVCFVLCTAYVVAATGSTALYANF